MVAVLLEDEKKTNMWGLKGKRRKLTKLERMCERKSSSKKEAPLTACSILMSDHLHSNFIFIFLVGVYIVSDMPDFCNFCMTLEESLQLLGFLQIFKSIWQPRL